MDYRHKQIIEMVPRGVKTILDVGSKGSMFNQKYKTTTLDLEGADINQNLNLNQKINLPDKCVDLVVLSQILEHLPSIEEIIEESKRISKKYILVGLPNELPLELRIRFLFNRSNICGYRPYGHKHLFNLQTVESFIKKFYGEYKNKFYLFGVGGNKDLIPKKIQNLMIKISPSLFARQVYYLIKVN
ncbi:methionine biosynthesis protein MetW [Candidatus Pacearchaeota archaeon]|nr:methionine biosynthesis protein MetW [Candidatus Pacearchaeota archaeon]